MKHKIPWKFVFAILLVLLTSCATQYRPNLTDRATARVRMVTTYAIPFVFTGVLQKACVSYNSIDWDKNAMIIEALIPTSSSPIRKSIGMPKSDISNQGDFVEVLIPSDEPINLGFHAYKFGYGGSICVGGVKFKPEQGRDYEVLFKRAGDMCLTSLRKLNVDSQGRTGYGPVTGAEKLPIC